MNYSSIIIPLVVHAIIVPIRTGTVVNTKIDYHEQHGDHVYADG